MLNLWKLVKLDETCSKWSRYDQKLAEMVEIIIKKRVENGGKVK